MKCTKRPHPRHAGPCDPARHQEHRGRPALAAAVRAGTGAAQAGRPGHPRAGRLRRLSDAGAAHFRPRTGRGRGRDGDRRNGPSAARNSISGRKGADADKRRLLRRRGTAL